MGTKKSKIHPKYKTKYRVQNWPRYDRTLAKRGALTLWLSPSVLKGWHAIPSGSRGRQQIYSDIAIEAGLMLRLVFRLPWRQTEGLLNSLFSMMGVPLRAPDHTTQSRRTQGLNLSIDQPKNPVGGSSIWPVERQAPAKNCRHSHRSSGWIDWAELMKRVFRKDVLKCERCQGTLTVKLVVKDCCSATAGYFRPIADGA